MTPLEEAHLIVSQETLPVDAREQVDVLFEKANATEQAQFPWIYEAIDLANESPELKSNGLTFKK